MARIGIELSRQRRQRGGSAEIDAKVQRLEMRLQAIVEVIDPLEIGILEEFADELCQPFVTRCRGSQGLGTVHADAHRRLQHDDIGGTVRGSHRLRRADVATPDGRSTIQSPAHRLVEVDCYGWIGLIAAPPGPCQLLDRHCELREEPALDADDPVAGHKGLAIVADHGLPAAPHVVQERVRDHELIVALGEETVLLEIDLVDAVQGDREVDLEERQDRDQLQELLAAGEAADAAIGDRHRAAPFLRGAAEMGGPGAVGPAEPFA